MNAPLAEIALSKGKFKVERRQGHDEGHLTVGTPIGQIRAIILLSPSLAGQPSAYDTGRTAAPIDIAPFDFAASAVNWVMQDAVSSGVSYMGNVAANESSAVHAAIHVIFKAALGDVECRQMMEDLAALSRAPTNIAFNQIQGSILARCGSCQNPMGSMTPDQIAKLAATYHRAYTLVESALPWLTENMNRLLAQLAAGHIDAAKADVAKRFVHGYGAAMNTEKKTDAESSPVEHYTTGGAPINIGKYRACVGCKCDDPCKNGCSCGSCGCEV